MLANGLGMHGLTRHLVTMLSLLVLFGCTSDLDEVFAENTLANVPAETEDAAEKPDAAARPDPGSGTDDERAAPSTDEESDAVEATTDEAEESTDRTGESDAPGEPDDGSDVESDSMVEATDETGETDEIDSGDASVERDGGAGRGDAGADAATDECPEDPAKLEPGRCGCGTPETDSDGDQTPDCVDECDDDPVKTVEGECGCGVEEDTSDVDGDEVIACIDGCPEDPAKTEPGECGCGIDEQTDDSDDDGAIDCLDACPDDPAKVEAGACGCGMPDTEHTSGALLCEILGAGLTHRYSFLGMNTSTAEDTIGDADGDIIGATAVGGELELAGATSDQYVELPANLLDGVIDLSVEAWVTWNGGDPWQRIFDFGSSDGGPGAQGEGQGHFLLTPLTDISGVGLRAAFGLGDGSGLEVSMTAPLPTNVVSHVVVVFDDSGNQLRLYLNGELAGVTNNPTFSLADIQTFNNWLGRSQYVTDPEFGGTFEELRLYDVALGMQAVNYSYEMGPDATYP